VSHTPALTDYWAVRNCCLTSESYDNYIFMKSHVSATQAVRQFSDLLNRVRYRGEEFIIERGGEPMCTLSPLKPPTCTGAELVALLRSFPRPDPGFWDAVEEATKHYAEMPESPGAR